MSTKNISLRKWTLNADDYLTEASFLAAVTAELAASVHMGHRLGIGLVHAPIRTQRLPGGPWATTGWLFQTAKIPGIPQPAPPASDEFDQQVDEMADLAGDGTELEPDAELEPELAA